MFILKYNFENKMKKKKNNSWAWFKVGKFTIKYSKENKTWQVWNNLNLITDYKLKQSARSYAEKHS